MTKTKASRPLVVAAGFLSVALAACQGGSLTTPSVESQRPPATGGTMSSMAPPMSLSMPKSVSPGLIAPAPMAKTAVGPADMTSVARSSPMQSIQGLNWTQIPGSAAQVVASPDGSLWVLSGGGADKAIYHYTGGTWSKLPGAAAEIATDPTGTLWVVNAGGGIYFWNGSGWTALAGGASAITIAADATIFVLSKSGGNGDRAIWHNAGSGWSQVPGAGVALAASLDPNSYSTPGGTELSNGMFVLNARGNIYYRNAGSGTYVPFQGLATAIAPTTSGGVFALGYPANFQNGTPLYYYNLNAPGWSAQRGAAISISANGGRLDAIGASGGIYRAPITASGGAAGPGFPLSGPNYGGLVTGCGTAGNICDGYAPADVATRLEFPVQQGYDGTGQTVAIVIDSDVSSSDISTYLAYNQTPSRTRALASKSVDGGGGTGDQGESTLDLETIAGLAPGANVTLYVIPSLSDQYIVDAYNQILSDNKAKVVNSSFAGCEFGNGMLTEDAVLAAGAQNGVAFVNASGDQGNECYNGSGYSPGVGYPASDPNAIGVGGSETFPSNSGADELLNPLVWNDSTCGNQMQCAGGGGVSSFWAIPGYQQGLNGVSSTALRNVPDVSMPGEYTSTYEAGAWGIVTGTSWSAPAFAALMAEVYEYCGTALENPVTVPYYAYNASGNSAFLDVTSGNDQYMGATPFYTAGTGYDNASGIGVPFGVPFAEAACPSGQPAAGLRRPRGTASYTTHRSAASYSLDVTPRVHGLVDAGRRSATSPTRIQIVLRATATLSSDERTVTQTLRSAGFTIVKTFSNHLVVDAEAPSATVERFFGTQMHDVAQGKDGTRYMPVATVTLPSSLAPYAAGVTLDDVVTKFVPRPTSQLKRR